MRTHPGPDAKTSAAPCQWSKYFQRVARSGLEAGKGTKLDWDRVGIVSGQMGLRRIPMDAQCPVRHDDDSRATQVPGRRCGA